MHFARLLQFRRYFPGPQSTAASMTPSLLPYRVPRRCEFSFGNRWKSKRAIPGKYEERVQIHIQSQQSWHFVACGQARCTARTENCNSVFQASFLRFPGVVASVRLYIMHRLSCNLAQDNQSYSPLTIPKD